MTAIHIAGQQSTAGIFSGITAKRAGNLCFAAILQRDGFRSIGRSAFCKVVRRPLLPALLHTLELLRRDNLQVRKYLRDTLTASEYTGVSNIDENVLDGGVMEWLTRAEVEKALLFERMAICWVVSNSERDTDETVNSWYRFARSSSVI